MRRTLAVVIGLTLAASAASAWAQEATQAVGADVWTKLVAANDLDLEGKTPFDLAMTFQLYDLDGKPTETGAAEVWWTAPGSPLRIVVQMAGLNEDGSAPEGADPALMRDWYLVRQLLEAAVHPVPRTLNAPGMLATSERETVADTRMTGMQSAGVLTTKSVKFGKITLDCTAPKASDATNVAPTTLCADPQTTDVMLLEGLSGEETVLRARTGKFKDTYVALDLRVGYLGKDAIAGKLTTMKVWDPASTDVKLPVATASTTTEPKAASVGGGVIAGHRVKSVEPEYPVAAKLTHVTGVVLMSVIIGEDGTVKRLVPIASTASMFTESAIEAVKHWVYTPYLLNGKPTKVDTMITVNFRLN